MKLVFPVVLMLLVVIPARSAAAQFPTHLILQGKRPTWLPPAVLSGDYWYQFQSTDAIGAVWSIDTTGRLSLPDGLSFDDATGTISGTPGRLGASFFYVTLQSDGRQAREYFAILTQHPTGELAIDPHGLTELPSGTVGQPYAVQLEAGAVAKEHRWEFVAGLLPRGLELKRNGTISGTPERVETGTFTARVEGADEGARNTPPQLFSIAIHSPPPLAVRASEVRPPHDRHRAWLRGGAGVSRLGFGSKSDDLPGVTGYVVHGELGWAVDELFLLGVGWSRFWREKGGSESELEGVWAQGTLYPSSRGWFYLQAGVGYVWFEKDVPQEISGNGLSGLIGIGYDVLLPIGVAISPSVTFIWSIAVEKERNGVGTGQDVNPNLVRVGLSVYAP